MRELAAKYGVSVGTVHNDIRTAIEAELEGVKEVVATAREIEERRLDHLLAKLMGQYENETDPNVTAKLATAALKVSEQRAKLLGLYAAEKIEAKVTGVASPAEAARLVREAFGEHASQKPNDSSARVPEAT